MADGFERHIHPFAPVYDGRSRALVLGTFPSVASREAGFYYGHPRNRFWRVMAALYGEDLPRTVGEKRDMLLSHGVALWDVLAGCELRLSSDASIRRAEPNDIAGLMRRADISAVYCNGRKAGELYARYAQPACGVPATVLPSTSPANAAWSLERLVEAWGALR